VLPRRSAWVFGLAYMGLSIAIEIVLIVVVRLRVPRDNAIIAPILLVIAPLAAAWWCGFRPLRELTMLWVLTVVLTIAFVFAYSRLTGISTGLIEPIIVRSSAGFLAAWIIKRMAARRSRRLPVNPT